MPGPASPILLIEGVIIEHQTEPRDTPSQQTDLAVAALLAVSAELKLVETPPSEPAAAIPLWANTGQRHGFIQQLLTVALAGSACRNHCRLPGQVSVIPVPKEEDK
jgi:hypothetical protein